MSFGKRGNHGKERNQETGEASGNETRKAGEGNQQELFVWRKQSSLKCMKAVQDDAVSGGVIGVPPKNLIRRRKGNDKERNEEAHQAAGFGKYTEANEGDQQAYLHEAAGMTIPLIRVEELTASRLM